MYLVFMLVIQNSRQSLLKLEFSQQIFAKYSNIKYHEDLSSGSWVFHVDRCDKANSHFLQLLRTRLTTMMWQLTCFYWQHTVFWNCTIFIQHWLMLIPSRIQALLVSQG